MQCQIQPLNNTMKEEKENEPFMMPRIKSKKKNGRKEIKLHNLLNIPAGAISHKPTSENQKRMHKIVIT